MGVARGAGPDQLAAEVLVALCMWCTTQRGLLTFYLVPVTSTCVEGCWLCLSV